MVVTKKAWHPAPIGWFVICGMADALQVDWLFQQCGCHEAAARRMAAELFPDLAFAASGSMWMGGCSNLPLNSIA
jgi:hypothetical protein